MDQFVRDLYDPQVRTVWSNMCSYLQTSNIHDVPHIIWRMESMLKEYNARLNVLDGVLIFESQSDWIRLLLAWS
jgi:hypothetical protein